MPTLSNDDKDIKKLQQTLKDLEKADLLHGSAIEGLSVAMERDASELESYDLDTRMAKADDDVAQFAMTTVSADVDDSEVLEGEIAKDGEEEDALLAEDETQPA